MCARGIWSRCSEQMAAPDLKIKKQSFRFDVRKRYSYETKYRKVEKQLADSLRESVLSFLKQRGAAKAAPSAGMPGQGEEEEAPGRKKPSLLESRALQKAAGAVLLALLLISSMAVFATSGIYPTQKTLNEQEERRFSGKIIAQDILTASEEAEWRKPYHTLYVAVEAEGGAKELPISVEVYDKPVPSSIFILRSSRYQAENYPEFSASLQSMLAAYGIPVNEIGFDELASLPSQSLVIVPSGYIPEQMLMDRGSKLDELLSRGVTVIYIGQPFDKMHSRQGAVVSGSTAPLGKMKVSFEPTTLLSCTNLA
ncbi:MAG: hypothetical protein QXH30_02710, partial [Candidatus Bilamarchaeaceae archaeon]